MALFEGALGVWREALLIGVGVAVAAPFVLPLVAAAVRPLIKELIKGSLFVVDSLNGLATTNNGHVTDLVMEAQAEYHISLL